MLKMISVIIPTYNVENYIHVCLNSVLNQTYDDYEIICIDDGSDDNTLEILNYFSKKDSRVKVYKNDYNMGPGYSRNRGLDEAKGDFIFFLDSDDWISPNTLKCVYNKIKSENTDLVIFKLIVFYDDYKFFGFEKLYDISLLNEFQNIVFNQYDLSPEKVFKIPDMPCNKLYRKSFLDGNNIRFTNENLIYEDTLFFFNVITKSDTMYFVDKYFYNRRRRPNSTMTLTNERVFDVFIIFKKILIMFNKNQVLWEYYKKELVNYFFKVLNVKYDIIDEEFKSIFLENVSSFFKYCSEYGLSDEIMKNVDKSILKKLNIVEKM